MVISINPLHVAGDCVQKHHAMTVCFFWLGFCVQANKLIVTSLIMNNRNGGIVTSPQGHEDGIECILKVSVFGKKYDYFNV